MIVYTLVKYICKFQMGLNTTQLGTTFDGKQNDVFIFYFSFHPFVCIQYICRGGHSRRRTKSVMFPWLSFRLHMIIRRRNPIFGQYA